MSVLGDPLRKPQALRVNAKGKSMTKKQSSWKEAKRVCQELGIACIETPDARTIGLFGTTPLPMRLPSRAKPTMTEAAPANQSEPSSPRPQGAWDEQTPATNSESAGCANIAAGM
ncbi:MAG: hypothetical protein RLY72_730 [Planctomycetota bacterium]